MTAAGFEAGVRRPSPRASPLAGTPGGRRLVGGSKRADGTLRMEEGGDSAPQSDLLLRLLCRLSLYAGPLWFSHTAEQTEMISLLSLIPRPHTKVERQLHDHNVFAGEACFFPAQAHAYGQWLDSERPFDQPDGLIGKPLQGLGRRYAAEVDAAGRVCWWEKSPKEFVERIVEARGQGKRLEQSHVGSLLQGGTRVLGLPGAPASEVEEEQAAARAAEEEKKGDERMEGGESSSSSSSSSSASSS
uniref:Uncharacterized protein n=1 Tax=Chromera velia CCMP2878 TaxID=1169474 RepID=A0A0G4FC94_9ALVE|eukprot:Cvel_16144.t1-p1 / transcript=Cvel_16144.t1 / gene=Cvel_16144 / organism=Chromera_velia_CCMP2878 / gene_product=hypothetical protein / transcript_product=hypothetical protein / location=Cvel_scaffold1229:35281-36012(-) / protein_length=244 / sequence_SO=supercontig / SO=protein_coding / is_pseudo=false